MLAAALPPPPAVVAPGPPRPALILRVRPGREIRLRHRPNGRTVAFLRDRTEFGRRTILGVTRVERGWAAVTTTLVANGDRAWVRIDRRNLVIRHTRWSIEADLTDRRLTLLFDGAPVRRTPITIGRRGAETPTGRFAVTDRLSGKEFGPTFGCCILAISARQPKVSFDGLDGRMALHGTNRPDLLGKRDSLGCLRLARRPLRRIMRTVPIGTPVTIRQ